MTDEPPKQPHGIGWYAAWGVVALVLGYPLSFGPACRIEGNPYGNSSRWFRTLYRPLSALAERSDVVATELMGYGSLWMRRGDRVVIYQTPLQNRIVERL